MRKLFKRIAKRALPQSLVGRISVSSRIVRDDRAAESLISDWICWLANPSGLARIIPNNVALIVPSDQRDVFGSRGDDAMICALAARIRASDPAISIQIAAHHEPAFAAANERGLSCVMLPYHGDYLANFEHLLQTVRPRVVVVVGADVIDGHYGAMFAVRQLLSADLAARHGIPTIVSGFSFNSTPSPHVIRVLPMLHADVALKVRDPVSLARVCKLRSDNVELVADCAFLLEPDNGAPVVAETRAWAAQRRQLGHKVIAFNCHGNFASKVTQAQFDGLLANTAAALAHVSRNRPVSWLLVPHDFRDDNRSDPAVLRPLYAALSGALGDDMRFLEGANRAAVLKGVAGTVDGVVTGRMHLSIASLGMGVPVAGLTYQEKFEGLFKLLDLPDWLGVPLAQAVDGPQLQDLILRFVDELDGLQAQLAVALPRVKAMAALNVAGLEAALKVRR